ncbi:MAG TPA: sigma 54-interacting transcriptional regulator, partial [Pirellulales bacterium]
ELSRDENHQLRRQIGVVSGLMGKSLGLGRVNDAIARAATSAAPVLISGELGVGKELVARSIHSDGKRANGPFVSLHCGAYSEDELAMELWGVEGALGDRPEQVGKYEAASGGTLLLDEIGELSLPLQEKVLRLLEGHPLRRLGGHEPLEVDVRLIASTSRDLNADVAAGRFRHDLFVRLKAEEIPVPALQRRPEDLPELAQHFLEHFAQDIGKRVTGFTPAAMERMSRYRWPGNIRELRNVIERAVLLARRPLVDTLDILLPSSIASGGDPLTLEEAERRHLQAVLDHTGWNLDDAAKKLGIDKNILQRKIDGFDLTKSG